MRFDEGTIQFENGGCKINLDFENCQINLVYKSNTIKWPDSSILLSNLKKNNLEWIPLILCGSVSGRVISSGQVNTYRNAPGYCDEVISTFLPWKLPVKQLYWGRFHHKLINLSFSILQDSKSLLNVSRLYLDVNGNFYVLTGLSIDILERKKNGNMNLTYVDKYMIQGHKDDLSISIEVSDHHEMILNDFMDYAGKYGTIATAILRWISRDPRGIKFRASANIIIHLNEKEYSIENASLVDEYVEFR